MNKIEIRKSFPYLDTGKIYLNHASLGPLTKMSESAVKRYLQGRVNGEDHHFTDETILETRRLIGQLINSNKDRIAFVGNTSDGLNLLAQGLSWERGDRVLVFNTEFPSNVYPFLNLKNLGVEVDLISPNQGKILVGDIESNITPRTKLITISHVQFLTGYRAKLEEIGNLCKSKGIIFCVDAIQSAGAVQIDVQKFKIDFLACGFQKWLLALEGCAFVYVSEELQDKINQKYVGWMSVKDAWNFLDYNLILEDSARRYETSAVNIASIYAVNSSLKFLLGIGINEVEKEVIDNTKFLLSKLQKFNFNPLYIPSEDSEIAGIVSIKHPDSIKLNELLNQNKIQCAVRQGCLRISPHFYNTKEELEKLIQILISFNSR
ncbi:MAG: aminotransferase class V-fold PLP-dependent enzyme [Ignavibacteria bacterium]|nr:aminotransferase class V-fold PLP-dependent enzyme [Ignavibacteria bacterium]